MLACFIAGHDVLRRVREAAGMPLRVVRLAVTCPARNMAGPAGVFQADLSVTKE